MSVCAVVGGQFGSEGKGLIVGEIAKDYGWHVRVGAANAGHTLYTPHDLREEGHPPAWGKHVMQQIPCAAYANPKANLLIGPGALISPDILGPELIRLNKWRRDRGHDMTARLVWIDPRAHVIQPQHIRRESFGSDLEQRIGSTSATAREGIGVAQAARVMREAECVLAGDGIDSRFAEWDLTRFCDVPDVLNEAISEGSSVLLEGTQGADLSLTTGAFPYVTSRNTTAAGLAADCGIAPNRIDRVIMVCRTFPIRVAGNSGPFYGGTPEIQWEDIGIDPEAERTTVTKKIRRVAPISFEQIYRSAYLNGATEIALTFCDYLDPRIAGSDSRRSGVWTSLEAYPDIAGAVDRIERDTGVPVTMLGTGPHSVIHLRRS